MEVMKRLHSFLQKNITSLILPGIVLVVLILGAIALSKGFVGVPFVYKSL